MRSRVCDILTVFLPMGVVLFLLTAFLVTPDREYSQSERRILSQRPKLSRESVTEGTYMEEFESYVLDQFPVRDWFLKGKALATTEIFRQKDNHGYYVAEGHICKLEPQINEHRLKQSVEKHRKLYESYLKETDCRLYAASIPDKNNFLADSNGYPSMDYDRYKEEMKGGLSFATFIDLYDSLTIADYYRSDPHWKQECLGKVIEILAEKMNIPDTPKYERHTFGTPFYGAYASQSSLTAEADTITYLTCEDMEDWVVTSYDTGMPKKVSVYDLQKVTGSDPYEMFLNGSDALLVIENPKAKTGRELVVFRDSFGSSLIPLMAGAYDRVTVVDLRYIRSEVLGQYVSFEKQDVLFIYSTLVF